MKPIIVSFFTRDTGYEAEAREMEATARAFGLFTDVRGVPSLGDWCANCALKPAYIRDRMQDYPGRPVVWVDADARFKAYPTLFEQLECDFAAHWRHASELLSGTLYFGPSFSARALVSQWCDEQMHHPNVWDQKVLQTVLDAGAVNWLTIRDLPGNYTRIFDDPKMGEPVIEHGQASRRLRDTVCQP